ncbi:OmpA family protein [Candidatus Dependentiae bacterium]|nr:MAG: OmpA family protein [Candidatus Dependentiae bacterium]
MKRLYILPLAMVLVLAGCVPKKKKTGPGISEKKAKKEKLAMVDIPVADDAVRSFFDEEIGEFAVLDDIDANQAKTASNDSLISQEYEDEFAWVEEEEANKDFDIVYFDFDKYDIRSDQEDSLKDNIKRAKDLVHDEKGHKSTVIVEGHSCSITNSRIYNFALSEDRARIVADKFIAAGIPKENIKVVGRGEEYPAIVDGKPIKGSREEQWLNRRVVIHIVQPSHC